MEMDKYKIGFIASGKKQIQNALATIQDEILDKLPFIKPDHFLKISSGKVKKV